MKHLDVTIDLETLSLSPNAAIVQIAAIPWNRFAPLSPFINEVNFEGYVDVRSCIRDGFSVDTDTVKWWNRQDGEIKDVVFGNTPNELKDILEAFSRWLEDLKETTKVKTVSLWAQGTDFDIAILRNAFARYKLSFPVDHSFIRDARTFIIENGAYILMRDEPMGGIRCAEQVYSRLPELQNIKKQTHNAVYDAQRTTWQVWHILKQLQHLSSLMGG